MQLDYLENDDFGDDYCGKQWTFGMITFYIIIVPPKTPMDSNLNYLWNNIEWRNQNNERARSARAHSARAARAQRARAARARGGVGGSAAEQNEIDF